MTNNDLIEQALRLIGVLAEGMTATAEQSSIGLAVMNEIADDWSENGVSLNWSEQDDVTADLTLSGAEKSAMQYELAVRLCPAFGREASPSLMMLAGPAYHRILRSALNLANQPVTASMPAAEGTSTYYDITTGGF